MDRPPGQGFEDPPVVGDEPGRIAGPSFPGPGLEGDAGDLPHGVDHFEDAEASAVAAIQGEGGAAGPEVVQGGEVGRGQVLHVDVVADAGAVRGGVVRAIDVQAGAPAQGRLAGQLDEEGGLGRGRAEAAAGIREANLKYLDPALTA